MDLSCGVLGTNYFDFFTEASAKNQMQNYITASAAVILYVEDLFTSRQLGLDW